MMDLQVSTFHTSIHLLQRKLLSKILSNFTLKIILKNLKQRLFLYLVLYRLCFTYVKVPTNKIYLIKIAWFLDFQL